MATVVHLTGPILVGPDEVDGWLEGAAAVRRGAADLADVQVFAEALGRGAATGAVAQLPHVDDDPWVGGALPDPSALNLPPCRPAPQESPHRASLGRIASPGQPCILAGRPLRASTCGLAESCDRLRCL